MVHQTVLSETDIKLRSPVYNLWVHVKEPLVVGNREEQPGYGATRAKIIVQNRLYTIILSYFSHLPPPSLLIQYNINTIHAILS